MTDDIQLEHAYNPVTGAYISSRPADMSPREPGVYLISAYATTIAPPAVKDDGSEVACFRDGAWVILSVEPVQDESEQQAPEPTPPTFEERLKALQDAVQAELDAQSRVYGYDSIASAVSYADEPAVPRFQREGQALRAWRSMVWAACYELLAQVQAGHREEPTRDELIAELPAYEAPEDAE
ncbi:hypothetical protein [Variovorax sp. DAIF25]|uniref:hypothetical protein n=1 Tax=Variovorax sp. DAIF25 TaxID=3080983 RepID=UPI003D6A3E6F